MMLPNTKARFHFRSRQSIWKKSEILPAPPMVQRVWKLLETPNRFPAKSNIAIEMAIKGPETYQGHGENKKSM
jgi:hypothetical protein